jgi:uncharacterized membrane protein YfcA
LIIEPLLLALISGLFGGLVGLGGGLVLVPALTVILGLPITIAIPASQVAVVATALGGTGKYIREGHTDVSLAIRAASVTVLGALLGARLGVLVPAKALELSFAALIFVIAWRMMQKKAESEESAPPAVARAGILFFAGGILAGMLGVGGGILNVPAIRLALKRSMITAVATSSMMVAFTGAAGAAVYAKAGHLDWPLAVSCTTGAFVGGRLGARLGTRLKMATLQTVFLVVILYVGVEMTVRALDLPWWR